MMGRLIKVLMIGVCSSTTLAAGGADADLFDSAQIAAEEGRLADMQELYERILVDDPNNIRALNGKAAAQAWQRDFDGAQLTYSRSIAVEPQNTDTLVGLGYAYAWAGAYTQAHTQFHRALAIDPGSSGARKGIGYSYHWAGEHELALGSFETAQSIAPDDAEIAEAIGRVKLSLGHSRDAVADFDRALQIDPTRHSASLARRSAHLSAPALELTTRFGSTSNAGSGLRAVEVAHWSAPTTRFAVRYDNSLGLDNSSISDRGEDARGYFVSVQQYINDRWIVGAEVGRRQLDAGDESMLTLQGSYNSAVGVFRLGTQIGRHEAGHTDKLVFGGFNFALANNWRIEPTVYLSQTGVARDNEWRSVVNAEYQSQSLWSAGALLGVGQIDSADSIFDGDTSIAGLWGSYLIADRFSLRLSVRRENTPTADFTVAEFGFTYRLPGN